MTLTTIILFILDVIILMVLMRFLLTANYGFVSSLIAALLGAFFAAVLTSVFTPAGQYAGVVAALLVSVGMGIGIKLVFNVGFAPAVVIGFIFLVVRSGVYYLLGTIVR